MNVKFIADFKSTPRTDKLLSDQQFDNVDYDTSCQQLTELCGELERELNEAMLNVRECELEIKDLTIRAQEAERVLKRCIAEMKYSADVGQPISLDRVEFDMAAKALGEE